MPASASYDEVCPIVGGRGGQLVRYRPVGIEHGLDADLDAVAAKVGLDVRKVRLCLRFQQVFGDFDERDVLGLLQEGQRGLDRAARFAGVLPGNQDTAALSAAWPCGAMRTGRPAASSTSPGSKLCNTSSA